MAVRVVTAVLWAAARETATIEGFLSTGKVGGRRFSLISTTSISKVPVLLVPCTGSEPITLSRCVSDSSASMPPTKKTAPVCGWTLNLSALSGKTS